MESQHLRYAFQDGFYTGLDPLGCILGYLKERIHLNVEEIKFIGHGADKYTLYRQEVNFVNMALVPITRGLEDQIIKAFGDIAGLGVNVCMLGIPQLIALVGSVSGSLFIAKKD